VLIAVDCGHLHHASQVLGHLLIRWRELLAVPTPEMGVSNQRPAGPE
jgi:hypothetical protein